MFKKLFLSISGACRQILVPALLISMTILPHANAQQSRPPDFTLQLLQQATPDTNLVMQLIEIAANTAFSDTAKKVGYATAALKMSESLNWYKGQTIANTLIGAMHFDYTRNYKAAIFYFTGNLAIAAKAGDLTMQVITLESIAKCYGAMGRHEQSLQHYYRAFALTNASDMKIGILADIGYTYTIMGDYAHALSSYLRSLKLLNEDVLSGRAADVQDTYQKAGLITNIGDIYLTMSQPKKAFENYNQVIKIGTEIKDSNLIVLGYIGQGNAHKLQKDFDGAIISFKTALSIAVAGDDNFNKCSISNDLAGTYLEYGDSLEALKYSLFAAKIAEQFNLLDELTKINATLGYIYLALNKNDSGIAYLKKAMSIAHYTGVQDQEKDIWELLGKAYEKTKKPADALDAYKHFFEIRDSLYNIKKANELTRIDLEYAFKVNSMRQEAIYDKKMERQRLLTYSACIAIGLVLLLSFFIYRSYKIQKKYNELLSLQKKFHLARIEAQRITLTDIADIQSHQVRGPVATILGLVQLFNFDDIADPINTEVIQGVTAVTEQLDVAVKEVIQRENQLWSKKKNRYIRLGRMI